jgi:hypothetical protein
MPDTNRNEFKVVIDGVKLDAAHHERINVAIQKAVASVLLEGGAGAGDTSGQRAPAHTPTLTEQAAIWATFGRTNGIVYRPLDSKLSQTLKSAGIEG